MMIYWMQNVLTNAHKNVGQQTLMALNSEVEMEDKLKREINKRCLIVYNLHFAFSNLIDYWKLLKNFLRRVVKTNILKLKMIGRKRCIVKIHRTRRRPAKWNERNRTSDSRLYTILHVVVATLVRKCRKWCNGMTEMEVPSWHIKYLQWWRHSIHWLLCFSSRMVTLGRFVQKQRVDRWWAV